MTTGQSSRWWQDPWLPPIWFVGAIIAFGYGRLQGVALLDPLGLLLVILVYPVLEEIVFRGLIQPALAKPTRGAACGPLTLANVLTSLLFAAMHLLQHAPLHAGLVLLPSLIFGLFRDRSGSVAPGMLLHVGWNAAVFLGPTVTM